MAWLWQSVMCLICWGVWGFFIKVANGNNPLLTMFASLLGSFLALGIGFGIQPDWAWSSKTFLWAGLASLVGTLGTFFFLAALRSGKTSIVVVFTALYPLVTVLLSIFFLRESLTFKQGLGIVLALIAMALFAE